jgi:TolB-like protein
MSTSKGKPLDVKTIGRELNVRYVLEGSVQRSGKRMRVNVQLIDAETGHHLWAERFDKPLTRLTKVSARPDIAGTSWGSMASARSKRPTAASASPGERPWLQPSSPHIVAA